MINLNCRIIYLIVYYGNNVFSIVYTLSRRSQLLVKTIDHDEKDDGGLVFQLDYRLHYPCVVISVVIDEHSRYLITKNGIKHCTNYAWRFILKSDNDSPFNRHLWIIWYHSSVNHTGTRKANGLVESFMKNLARSLVIFLRVY